MLKYISVVVRNALAMMTAAPGVASRFLSTVNSGHGQSVCSFTIFLACDWLSVGGHTRQSEVNFVQPHQVAFYQFKI